MYKAISRTKVKRDLLRKTDPSLNETIRNALKNKNWIKIAKIVAGSTRKYASVNLKKIDNETKTGDTVIILGKVLSTGDITKKVRICSLSISATAHEKLKKTKSEYATVLEEIKKNPKAEGIKIIS